MSYRPSWTDAEDQTAHGMHVAGASYATIAAEIGRTPHAVEHHLRDLRRERRTGIRHYFCKPHPAWGDDQLDTCITLWRAGRSARYIGGIIGKSRNAVIGKMGRMYIKKHQPAPKQVIRRMVEPAPEPPPAPVLPPPDYTARICSCGGTNQPGRGLCAKCINKRHKPNPRANVFIGLMRDSA